MNLLQITVSGGILVVVVTIIRALAINHLPKKTFLVMWGIVLFRLLLPFSLPSSFSIYSLVNFMGTAEQANITPATNFLPIVNLSISGTDHGIFTSSIDKFPFWTIVWIVGMSLCGLYFSLAYLKCRYEFRSSQIVENDFTRHWLNANSIKRTITIRQTKRISAPLTYGIFHPVILMPEHTDWTDTKKMQYVFVHEISHIKRFDSVIKIILTVALCVHWFNPLVWVMYVLANRDIELSCDETVIHSFGETVKSAYALALISMEEQKSRLTPFCNSFSETAIEERIKAIMKTKRTTKLSVCISIAAILCVAIPFATNAQALTIPANDAGISQTFHSVNTTVNDGVTTIPIDIKSINSDEYVWLGEYTLSAGDTIRYDIPTITGEKIAVGFAALTTVSPTYFTNINDKELGYLSVNGSFEVTQERAGQYRLFIKAEQGQLTNIKGVIKFGKLTPNKSTSPEAQSVSRPDSTGIKCGEEDSTVYSPDTSKQIVIPVSVKILSADTAIGIGQIPNIKNMSELKYDVHAPEGTGNLYVAMRKTNDDRGTWFNYVGMVGEGKTGRDIVWKMDGDSDENFGYDAGYSGNYSIFILSKSGDLSGIDGTITITYDKPTFNTAKTDNPSNPLTVPISK